MQEKIQLEIEKIEMEKGKQAATGLPLLKSKGCSCLLAMKNKESIGGAKDVRNLLRRKLAPFNLAATNRKIWLTEKIRAEKA